MISVSASPDAWRCGAHYDYLMIAERSMFAWEWLRRTSAYRRMWTRTRRRDAADRIRAAQAFGLVELAPPTLTAMEARPIWRAARDPHVLRAHVANFASGADDMFDIRLLASVTGIGLDEEDAEHWRIDIAGHAIRIDVHGGTLLGGPTLLTFQLTGLKSVRPKLPPLDLLTRGAQGLASSALPRERRAARWIEELRVADALADGASQQEIARTLYGEVIPLPGWRAHGESYRLRVQRLVRAARARLREPLDPEWFR